MPGMGQFDRYHHHGRWVWVRQEDRGKHRDHGLCHVCGREGKCNLIKAVFALCELTGLTLPVWECPDFYPKDEYLG